ncbi:hypothetical protein SAY87_026702 [Trapa incisa]|uniref:Spindle and kinetochore-associated protein 3 n=1 Tax=Trapa incisa TaxID=236973 RepID=A0AAN7GYA2_9MYRT|nr:hypothetical protein SAY87_026702 [Trapa incisa]
MNMDEKISMLSKNLSSFCNHLQTSVDALKQSIDRRPIPLDSASSTFIQSLNRRVSSSSNDFDILESISLGSVSFEELLGHCYEVFKRNQSDLTELEDYLRSFGYVPEVDIEEDEEGSEMLTHPENLDMDLKSPNSCGERHQPSSYAEQVSAVGSLEDDLLFDESLSLRNLGISEVSLATLASEANNKTDEPYFCSRQPTKFCESGADFLEGSSQSAADTEGSMEDYVKPVEAPKNIVKVIIEDYESLPSHLKVLASWEELLGAVDKINASLRKRESTRGTNHLFQDEISSMSLGPKARPYLLLLVRMKKLVVETVDGLISYKVLL